MYTITGDEVTMKEIKTAVTEGRAVIHWSHGEWVNYGGLAIYNTIDEADIEAERDTRGECWSMADEVWSHKPTNNNEAIRAAKGLLKQ